MRTLISSLAVCAAVVASGADTNQMVVVDDNTPMVGQDNKTRDVIWVGSRYPNLRTFNRINDSVPFSVTGWATTTENSQTTIRIHLWRGANMLAASTNGLGDFQIVGIEPAPKGIPRVEFTITVTEHQILLSACGATNKMPYKIRRTIGGAKK